MEKKFVELLKQYLYPWIDVDLVCACYQYDFKGIVRSRETADFCVNNTLITLASSKMLARDKFINMQLLLHKHDGYHTESVFFRTIVFKYRNWETRFRHDTCIRNPARPG